MKKELLEGNFGIEKETLRVDINGNLVSTKHPINSIRTKFKNPHITVDFSEQQVEVITGINSTIDLAVNELKLLTNIVYRSMNNNEYLWNYSIPYGLTNKATIALGKCKEVDYRKKLLSHSTFDMQLISGVHFNFSFKDEFSKTKSDDEINAIYFKISKRYARVSYLIKQMFGMSPTKDFVNMDRISYRQSNSEGYHNNDEELKCFCNFSNYDEYVKFINNKIKTKIINSFREVYTNIRMKPLGAKRIQWIEVRNVDLDYTEEYGVNVHKLKFIHNFLTFLAFSKNTFADQKHTESADEFNFESSLKILNEMKSWMILESLDTKFIDSYIEKFNAGKYDAQVKPSIKDLINKQIELKKSIKKISLSPIEDMELSSQILIECAYKSGMPVKIVDQAKNKLKIKNTIIEMATLNPFDSKKGLEIIDSKIKTNKFLKMNNINATEQTVYIDLKNASKDFNKFKNMKIVIKPSNTNFSKGLTVFETDFDKKDFVEAIKYAFSFDKTVIVEKFIQGQEYRFLVIDSKVIGILKRVPANVVGDSKHSIKELIDIKNTNILRGNKYKLPLEKIKLGQIEKNYLEKQGLNVNSILEKGKQIFLRKNSNVSTGGDTYDVTDKVAKEYKDIAIDITSRLNLKVCGLDIIIPNISKFGIYTILEMNWNPAIHIHTYPLVGKNRKPAEAIIKMIRKYDDGL